MNKERVINKLISDGYTENQARITVLELMDLSESLEPALKKWVENGTETEACAEGFSLMELKTKYQMTYPAALLSIDWLIKEPQTAINVIKQGIR